MKRPVASSSSSAGKNSINGAPGNIAVATTSATRKKRRVCARDYSQLYVSTVTLSCALNGCVPCLYKIFPGGELEAMQVLNVRAENQTSNDWQYPQNQRPEKCPRADNRAYAGLFGYGTVGGAMRRVLTVGDGDLSFSKALAEQFDLINEEYEKISMGTGDATTLQRLWHLVATTHEPLSSLLDTYGRVGFQSTLERLQQLRVQVLHEINAAVLNEQLLKRLPTEAYKETANEIKFDFIVWNFPCVSLLAGADGQVNELEANRNLVQDFFRTARPLLRNATEVDGIYIPHGELHIAHKTIEPFSWWGIIDIAHAEGFELLYATVFDRCNYPGYTNRKALDYKSFSCNDAQIYVFRPLNAGSKSLSSLTSLLTTKKLQQLQSEEVTSQLNDLMVRLSEL